MKKFAMSIDHPSLVRAKHGFDECLKRGVHRAISTGSNKGTVTLTVRFEVVETLNEKTGEMYKVPIMKFKAGYSVPMKEGCDGTVTDLCRIVEGPGNEFLLVNNQVSMDEILQEQEDG